MSGLCGEVLTLQLGHYANFVGTHWWNLQGAALDLEETGQQDSEICSDVLFRQGVTLRGQETYTPRLILLDLKGSLSSLRQEGCLYEDEETMRTIPAWTGSLASHQEEPPIRNPFLDLSKEGGETLSDRVFSGRDVGDTVRGGSARNLTRNRFQLEKSVGVWSDFLRTSLHPKSVSVINQYNHAGETDGLVAFSQGEALLKQASYLDEIEDRLHFFTEECDYLQGFQIVCDLHTGFSGVGAKMAELLHDEFPGRCILSWGTYPVLQGESNPQKEMYRLFNTILGLVNMSGHSSLFCPLTLNSSLGRRPGPHAALPHLLYDAESQYHSSAVLAIALETLSVPYRMSSSHLSMMHLAETLNFCGRKVVTAASSLPFPWGPSDCLPDALLPHTASAPWGSLSACLEEGAERSFSQSVVLRGICKEKQNSRLPAGTRSRSALHTCDTGEDILQCYLQTLYPGTVSMAHLLQAPCKLGPTFPQFFSPYVTQEGFSLQEPLTQPPAVHSVPVLTALQTSATLHSTLQRLYQEVKKVDVRRWASFFTADLELDDFQEAVQHLQNLSQCYRSREAGESDGSD